MTNIFQRLNPFRKKAIVPPSRISYPYLGAAETVLYSDKKKTYVREGYIGNDIVYSIINLITNKVKVPTWGWYTIKDEKAYNAYMSRLKNMCSIAYDKMEESVGLERIVKDYKDMMGLRNKALEAYNPQGRLAELIKYPNETQTWADMVEEGVGFKLITGDKFRWAMISEAPLSKGLPLELNNLASQCMLIKTNGQFPLRAASYTYHEGILVQFEKEEVMHEKYYNPDWDAIGSQLYGLSPVRAAKIRMQNVKEGLLTGIATYQNGGADGILSPDSTDIEYLKELTWEQLGATKERIEALIKGGSRRAGEIAILNSPWKYTRVRMSPVDLNIIESEKWNMRMLCNIWQVPSQLMNDPDNKIQANANSGERALTLRCSLPALISERDNMNRKFQTDWGLKGKNTVLDFDVSAFSELEENKKDQVDYLERAYWLTPNRKLSIMGEPLSTDPNMDRVWMPSNLIPMDDMSTQQIDDPAPDLEEDNDIE